MVLKKRTCLGRDSVPRDLLLRRWNRPRCHLRYLLYSNGRPVCQQRGISFASPIGGGTFLDRLESSPIYQNN